MDVTGCMFGGAIVAEDAFSNSVTAEVGVSVRLHCLPLTVVCLWWRQSYLFESPSRDFGSMLFRFRRRRSVSVSETAIPLSLTLGDTFGVSGKQLITYDVAAEVFGATALFFAQPLAHRHAVGVQRGGGIGRTLLRLGRGARKCSQLLPPLTPPTRPTPTTTTPRVQASQWRERRDRHSSAEYAKEAGEVWKILFRTLGPDQQARGRRCAAPIV